MLRRMTVANEGPRLIMSEQTRNEMKIHRYRITGLDLPSYLQRDVTKGPESQYLLEVPTEP